MTIAVHNRQRRVRLDLAWLRNVAQIALAQCAEYPVAPGTALSGLEHVDVAIVSDKRIASIHEQFMRISGPTDVITFDHGEIVISAETAQENARRFSQPLEHELALYAIHGLLHLNGYDDHKAGEAAKMRRLQESVLKRCLAEVASRLKSANKQ